MLSRVIIQNFKSIGEPGVDLELKPLTLLVGPNGGGKSSILEAIVAAAKEGVGLENGRLLRLSPPGHLLHRRSASRFSVAVTSDSADEFSIRLEVDTGGTAYRHYLRNGQAADDPETHQWGRQFEPDLCTKVFPLRSTRGRVALEDSPHYPQWVGDEGQYLLAYLDRLSGPPDPGHSADALNRIVSWAKRFGITNLRAGTISSNQVGARGDDALLECLIELAEASAGTRQVLSVIAQLFGSLRGSLLLVEEPEISLHPQAQIDLMELFGEVIKADKQIIATTHSHYLLMAIGYGVQQGWLNKDDVAVYHVVKKPETGTEASRLELGKDGYLKDWVPSYNAVERRLMRAWPKVPEEQT